MESLHSHSHAGPAAALEILGDAHPLVRQIGGPAALDPLAAGKPSVLSARVETMAGLRKFLHSYVWDLLIPHELPVIYQSYLHTSRGHVVELLALDERLAAEPLLQPFAVASELSGRTQLLRLRPLKDQRLIQKYLQAVESGKAHAWHTILYGLVLATYSLPLRQGLSHYGQRTLQSFLDTAARNLPLSSAEQEGLFAEFSAAIPPAVDDLITTDAWQRHQTA
jgi:urease accessory protein UreF